MRDYYALPFMSAALPARLTAIERATPPHAAVLDIGCHDATISRHLLSAGRARSAVCVDRAPLSEPPLPEMRFLRADARNLRYGDLGTFDLALLLNVLHHVVHESVPAATELVRSVVDVASVVLIEMGSFTEHGPWGWRRTYNEYWQDDAAMWSDLFGAVPRHRVLQYPGMGGGSRTMWQLAGRGTRD